MTRIVEFTDPKAAQEFKTAVRNLLDSRVSIKMNCVIIKCEKFQADAIDEIATNFGAKRII